MPQVIRNTGIDDIHLVAAQYRWLTGQDPISATGPVLTSISPTTAVAGGAQFTLTCTGTGFISGRSQVVWGADPVATTFVSATSLTAVITADKIAAAGDVLVSVITGSLTTATKPFTITAAALQAEGTEGAEGAEGAEEPSADIPDETWLKADIVDWLLVNGSTESDTHLANLTKAELLVLVADINQPA